MCGIVGYAGNSHAAPVLINSLQKLEYRGYDSAGIALLGNTPTVKIIKTAGRLSALENLVPKEEPQGSIGIGHTRWATHGEPSAENAHPHSNQSRTIALVHNGIIENHGKLREELSALGYRFLSQTDTETAVHLLDYYYKREKNPKKAIRQTLLRLEGSYAFGILFAEHPNTLFAARKDSPLAIGIGKGESFIASDAPAILQYTREVIYLDNGEIAEIQKDKVRVYRSDLTRADKQAVHIKWSSQSAEKNGFADFMLKEIYEQPAVIENTLSAHITNEAVILDELALSQDILQSLRKIHIVACGSAYHAGVVGKQVIERLTRIPVEVEYAGEFRYREPILKKDSLCLAISQSGETADTLAALREAKRQGVFTLAIVNVAGSSIAREADSVIYTLAGPEIAVATTKAYSAQLATLYLLALHLAFARGRLKQEQLSYYLGELKKLPAKISELLEYSESIKAFAEKHAQKRDVFFIGRGIDCAAALEASLKLKEISYIHSEAYAASELKHGTISLIEQGTLVVSLATEPRLFEKMLSSTAETLCRGAEVFALTVKSNTALLKSASFAITLPAIDPLFSASLSVVPLQLFAYHVALAKGLDADKPRNLAKSVTVE